MSIDATVDREPGLFDAIGYPLSIPRARAFATTPGMEGSVFSSELAKMLGEESNLSRAATIRWLKEFLALYSEKIVAEETTSVELLRLDLHVPRIAGATGRLTVTNEHTDATKFEVTVFGSGGGGDQIISFAVSDEITADACTRESYSTLGTWELVEIATGVDRGRRFVRLRDLARDVTQVTTSDIPEPHCDLRAAGLSDGRRCFDYREGAIQEASTSLSIESSTAWQVKAGLSLPKLGVDTAVSVDVKRKHAIKITCSVPGGHAYEAYTVPPAPFWNWAVVDS